jgi:Mg2+ and Co2+ transporter CorA
MAFELTYQAQVTNWLTVQPDVQFIKPRWDARADRFTFFTRHPYLLKGEQMMTFYRIGEPGAECVDLESCPVLTQSALWIDLFEPSQDEEKAVEAALGFEVPTREEMQKIVISSRLYREKDILFMTATILTKLIRAIRKAHPSRSYWLRDNSSRSGTPTQFHFKIFASG